MLVTQDFVKITCKAKWLKRARRSTIDSDRDSIFHR